MGMKNERGELPSFLQLLALLAIMVAAIQYLRIDQIIETQQPVDACRDGYVYSWDGKMWHPVYIRKTKRQVPCDVYGDEVVK